MDNEVERMLRQRGRTVQWASFAGVSLDYLCICHEWDTISIYPSHPRFKQLAEEADRNRR